MFTWPETGGNNRHLKRVTIGEAEDGPSSERGELGAPTSHKHQSPHRQQGHHLFFSCMKSFMSPQCSEKLMNLWCELTNSHPIKPEHRSVTNDSLSKDPSASLLPTCKFHCEPLKLNKLQLLLTNRKINTKLYYQDKQLVRCRLAAQWPTVMLAEKKLTVAS